MMVNSGVRWLTKFINFSQKISKSGGLNYSLTKLSPHKCCIYWVGLDLCKPIIVIFPHPNPTGIRDRQFGTSVQDISQSNKHEGDRRNLPSIFESYLGVMRVVNTWGKPNIHKAIMRKSHKNLKTGSQLNRPEI